MKAYVNPPHGNDATAILNSRAFPFKTHKKALEVLNALPLPEVEEGMELKNYGQHQVTETWGVPPAEDVEE